MKKCFCLHKPFMSCGLNNYHSRNTGQTFHTVSVRTRTDILWFSSAGVFYTPPTPCPQHRVKTSAHASTLLKSALRTWCQVFRMLSKTQNGSDFDVLPFLWKCKRNNERDNLKTINNYSLHVQEVVLCKKINQRWLSINLLYKTFFNWTIQRYFS
jgi:hypothetical protein